MRRKFLTLLIASLSLTGAIALTSCAGMDNNNGREGENANANNQLRYLYDLAVANGFTGTYEQWVAAITGQAMELKVIDGYVCWRYTNSQDWTQLVPLSELQGADGQPGANGQPGTNGRNGNDGQDGKNGNDGQDGLTPYIGGDGNWWIGDFNTGILARGTDGITPHIGEDGFWYIGEVNTWVPARGTDGKDGITPHIGTNGNWYIGDVDTGVNAYGTDGQTINGETPYIGEDGNWWIGEINTGVLARGTNGKDGVDGVDGLTPYIGEDGNWWIGDFNTGILARGTNGTDGLTPYIGENGNWFIGDVDTNVRAKEEPGKSAYEIFLQYHPEYQGTEEQWINDMIQGKFAGDFKVYNVTFDDGDGNIIDQQEIISSQPIVEPEAPKKVGYIFTGWYWGEEKWNFNSNVVLSDVTLVAHWIRSSATPTVYFTYSWADQYSIDFDFHVDELSTIEAIALYRGGELIESLEDLNLRKFENLLSGTEYRIELTYSYDMQDGFGKQFATVNKYQWTNSLNAPNFWLQNINATATEVTFDYYEDDWQNIGEVTDVAIYKNNQLFKRLDDPTQKVVAGLYSNTDYTIVVTYSYDLNDGMPLRTLESSSSFRTQAYVVPVIKLDNESVTQNTISGELVINDRDGIGTFGGISLYNSEDSLIGSTTSSSYEFTDLNENEDYYLKVNYTYDLQDGAGVQDISFNKKLHTHPVYQLLSTSILNTSAIVEGDTVYIHAIVENPSNSRFTTAVINGKEYNVDPASTPTELYVSFKTTEPGDILFTITELRAVLNGQPYSFYTSNENFVIAKVYNLIGIKSACTLNSSLEETEVLESGENYYIKVTLDNPANYAVKSIKVNDQIIQSEAFISNDGDSIVLKRDPLIWNDIQTDVISSVSYENEEISKETAFNYRIVSYSFSKMNYIEVNDVDDLLSLSNYYGFYHITLNNDIDLSGVDYSPIRGCNGIFDGNGHAISNITFTRNASSSEKIGLFATFSGCIKNLTLDSVRIMTVANFTNIRVGSFAGETGDIKFDNCNIIGNSSISFEDCSGDEWSNQIGGFVGNSNGNVTMNNCYSNCYISAKANQKVGAICGSSYNPNGFYIYNSGFSGNITKGEYGENALQYLTYVEGYSYRDYVLNNVYITGYYNNNDNITFDHNDLKNAPVFYRISNCCVLTSLYPNEKLSWIDHTITFDANGGELDTLQYTGKVASLPTPTKQGFVFAGWYENSDFSGNALPQNNYYFDSNKTIYARWLIPNNLDDMITNNDLNQTYTVGDNYIYSNLSTNGLRAYFDITAEKRMLITFDCETLRNSQGVWSNIFIKNSFETIYEFTFSYDYPKTSFSFILEAGETFTFYCYQNIWDSFSPNGQVRLTNFYCAYFD